MLASSTSNSQDDSQIKDFTNFDLGEFGVEEVAPKKDPATGFIVAGKNPTSLILKLLEINGRKIAELEKIMRPGQSSNAGFLGKDENLLEIMAADNKYVVDEMGLTHQELAKHLHAMGAIWQWQMRNKQSGAFLYHGWKYKVSGVTTRGFQPSPFGDGTKSGSNVTVTNLKKGDEIEYGLLVPYMIERYGFYEGKGTSYRVEPRKVIRVFDFMTNAKKTDLPTSD